MRAGARRRSSGRRTPRRGVADPLGRAAGQVARDHRAHAPRRRASPPRCCASPARWSRPGVTTDEIDAYVHELCIERNAYPSPLNYNRYPKSVCTSVNEVICHGIPDTPAAAGRRHRQPRRHHVHRRRARRHQRHVPRRRRRPGEPPAGAGHRGVHVARHRGRQAGPPAQRHRPGHRGPRQEAPLRRGAGVHRPRHR